MRRTISLLTLLLAVLACATQSASAGARTASDDVRLLGQQLETIHPQPFRHFARDEFRAEVDTLARRAARLSADELLVGLMRVTALLGPRNGHSGIFPLDPLHRGTLHLYPLRLYDFADGVHVVDDAGGALVGSRLLSIAGVPVDRVLELVRPLVPRDNSANLRGWAPHYALVAEVLAGLGIVEGVGPVTFAFEKPTGEVVDVSLAPVRDDAYVAEFRDALHGHYPAALPRLPRPLYLAQSGRELWMTKLARGRAVYVGYNAVVVDTTAPAVRLKRLLRSPTVRRLIVDVRLNGGGDNTTYLDLLSALQTPKVNRRGRLFLLMGRATFSAAGNFATDVKDYTRAIAVGEPTGGGVKIYSETTSVALPSVGWNVRIATQYMERGAVNDQRLGIDPDVRVDLTSTDFFAGRDPVLARALRGLQ